MAKITKRSIGYYTQGLNTGVEYAVREDGRVFSRVKQWNGRFYTTSKWTRDEHWDKKVLGTPMSLRFGFGSNGRHFFVDSTHLRLPQE